MKGERNPVDAEVEVWFTRHQPKGRVTVKSRGGRVSEVEVKHRRHGLAPERTKGDAPSYGVPKKPANASATLPARKRA